MPWVYRYIDVFDNIKYVGIVWGPDRTLDQRINEHTIDWWYKESPSWKIEYMEENIPNRATAEALESHYIAKYNTGYINGNGFNKSKEGWGEIAAFNHNEENWIPYDSSLNPYFITYSDILKGEWLNAGQQILTGFNDLATLKPELAKEWHPTKNGGVSPTTIALNSHKKYWWQCDLGHEWRTAINTRTGLGLGCPECAKNRRKY